MLGWFRRKSDERVKAERIYKTLVQRDEAICRRNDWADEKQKRASAKMPRPSLPGPIGPDYTKPGRALPSQPRTPDRSPCALNTEAMTMSVTDLTPKRSRWRSPGFGTSPV